VDQLVGEHVLIAARAVLGGVIGQRFVHVVAWTVLQLEEHLQG
jgi:hypothetical protein